MTRFGEGTYNEGVFGVSKLQPNERPVGLRGEPVRNIAESDARLHITRCYESWTPRHGWTQFGSIVAPALNIDELTWTTENGKTTLHIPIDNEEDWQDCIQDLEWRQTLWCDEEGKFIRNERKNHRE